MGRRVRFCFCFPLLSFLLELRLNRGCEIVYARGFMYIKDCQDGGEREREREMPRRRDIAAFNAV